MCVCVCGVCVYVYVCVRVYVCGWVYVRARVCCFVMYAHCVVYACALCAQAGGCM